MRDGRGEGGEGRRDIEKGQLCNLTLRGVGLCGCKLERSQEAERAHVEGHYGGEVLLMVKKKVDYTVMEEVTSHNNYFPCVCMRESVWGLSGKFSLASLGMLLEPIRF